MREQTKKPTARTESGPDKATPAPSRTDQTRLPGWALRLPIQTKLTVNQPGDIYEQEADAVAEQVMGQPSADRLPRDDPGTKRRHTRDQEAKDSVVRSMEGAFGTRFSDVELRTDTAAADRASALNAHAYTDGKEIGFARGQFAPNTRHGLHTIAHEFAHVRQIQGGAQQGGGLQLARLSRNGQVYADSVAAPAEQDFATAAVEAEADAAAEAVVDGNSPDVDGTALVPLGVLKKGKSGTPDLLTPKRGHLIVSMSSDMFTYIFNTEDARTWADWKSALLFYHLRYLYTNFDTDVSSIAQEYLATGKYSAEEGVPVSRWNQPYAIYSVYKSLNEDIRRWLAIHHPGVDLRARDSSTTAKIKDGIPFEKLQLAGSEEHSEGIQQFAPKATLGLYPRVVTYVAGSTLSATVTFDWRDTDNAMINIFPRKADFAWKLIEQSTKKVVDNGPLLGGTGEINYEYTLPETPGTYIVEVTTSSRYFFAPLTLSQSIEIQTEADIVAKEFSALADPKQADSPFERQPDQTLRLKPNIKAHTIEQEILLLNAQIGAIRKLREQGSLTDEQAKEYEAYFGDKLKSLEAIRDTVSGKTSYVLAGVFVSREDSIRLPITVYMSLMSTVVKDGQHTVKIELYDSTLSRGQPKRHRGEGTAATAAEAEKSAINDMADHWHSNNDFPYGTIYLGVNLVHGNGVYEKSIDTYNYSRTAQKVFTVVAAVGGAALIIASPLTGGASAPVGVLILEGVVAAATLASVALVLKERIATGTFAFDREFVLDMLTVVTTAIGGYGSFARALRGAEAVGRGYLLTNLTLGAGQMVVLHSSVKEQILGVEAKYAAEQQLIVDQLNSEQDGEKRIQLSSRLRQIPRERDSAIAQILGSAAVSQGMMLVALGMAGKGVVEAPSGGTGKLPTDVEPPVAPKPPVESPVEPVPTPKQPSEPPVTPKPSVEPPVEPVPTPKQPTEPPVAPKPPVEPPVEPVPTPKQPSEPPVAPKTPVEPPVEPTPSPKEPNEPPAAPKTPVEPTTPKATSEPVKVIKVPASEPGHEVTITKDRKLYYCSDPCQPLEDAFAVVLKENQKLREELDALKSLAPSADEATLIGWVKDLEGKLASATKQLPADKAAAQVKISDLKAKVGANQPQIESLISEIGAAKDTVKQLRQEASAARWNKSATVKGQELINSRATPEELAQINRARQQGVPEHVIQDKVLSHWADQHEKSKLNPAEKKLGQLSTETYGHAQDINKLLGVDQPAMPNFAAGGAHGDVRAKTTQFGGEVNHMPADSISPLSSGKGPAIWMTKDDHLKTKSWGSSKTAIAHRAAQEALIKKGDFRGAVKLDVDDIRGQFGNKYDDNISKMLSYIDDLEAQGLIKPSPKFPFP